MHVKNTNKLLSIAIGMILIATWLAIAVITIALYIHALQNKLPDEVFVAMLIALWAVSLSLEWKWWSDHFLSLEKKE